MHPQVAQMAAKSQPQTLKLAASVLLLFVVGTPIVAWLWETLNHLLSGHVEPLRLLIAVPVGGVLYLILKLVARFTSSLEHTAPPSTREQTP